MRKLVSIAAALVLLFTHAFAQDKTVTGKVTDEKDGSPLPGVSVSVKGTNLGTTTGADGTFKLSVPSSGKVLVISFVNYESKEVAIGSRTNFEVGLTSASQSLSEVVVVGYGTQQKKAFTGSASKINTKEFAQLVTPSVDRQLAGRAAGVQVSTPGGLVNTPARIRVRGINSINGGLAPLIVVDGVPFITGNLAGTTNSNALGDINPNDIENIEVLKDGSATAIFGSRAANGVIMITTKKGDKSGRLKVNYDVNYGRSSVMNRWDLLNADEFVTIANEKFTNAGVLPRAFRATDGTNTDWQNIAFNTNASAVTHNIGFSGGTQKSTYFFSFGYTDQKGVIVSNTNKTYRIRFNYETEINKYLKFGTSNTLSRQEDTDQNNGSNSLGGSVASTLRLPPNVSPFNSAHPTGFNIQFPTVNSIGLGPNTQVVDDNFSNIAFTLPVNLQKSDKHRIVTTNFLELAPVKGLKIRTSLTYDMLNDYSFLSWDPRHGDGFSSIGIAQNIAQVFSRVVWQNFANYNKSFGNHNLYLTAGHEIQKDLTRWTSATGSNVADIFFIKENVISGAATVQQVGGFFGESAIQSVFGRFNYDFKNKYFAQVSLRRDGLSSLSQDNRFGVFPGFSAGWRPSEEGFWKSSRFLNKWLTDFKIKGSYAIVGNPLTGFPFLSTFANAQYGNISGVSANLVGNPDLQWERSKKYDIGIEASILRGRFTLGVDWFRNDIDELVLQVPTPPSAGVPGNFISQNVGKQRNKGIELSLSGDIVRGKNFNWNFNVNYTSIQNEILSLYAIAGNEVKFIPNGNYNLIRVGDPINILYGLRWAGVNSANGNPMYFKADGRLVQHNIATGTFHFAGNKNDPTLGAQTSLTFDDRANLGQAIPTWFGGISNNFSYKGFNLEVFLRYSGGNKIMNITRQEALLNQSFQNNGREILQRWTAPGQITNVPRLVWGQGNNINQNNLAVSRFVENGEFLRLQNVVLGYTFKGDKLSAATNGFVKNLRVFMQGQNLFIWTKYTGADPENASEAGLDAAVSPQVRIFSGGISVGF
jgi:TonB-dependent starch-binding outer membrane protein SusC